MAMIDYGAIAFKNGKMISTEFFTPMIDMVGWEDTENDVYHNYSTDKDEQLDLEGNYFAYIGDADCTIAFYKCQIVIVQKCKNGTYNYHHEWLDCTDYTWSKWERYIFGADAGNVKVTKRNGYYVCKWEYKGDKYKVYFGYGVDFSYYKKWRIVNYYRSPEFLFHKSVRWIKNKMRDIKWELEYRFKH